MPEKPAEPVTTIPVKAKGVTLGEARLVSKSFALKFLRKAFIGARIQRVPNPESAPKDSEYGPLETWRVWAISNGRQVGVIEVTAPLVVLPYSVVREAYLQRLNMEIHVKPIRNGVTMSATACPPQLPPEILKQVEDAIKTAETQP